MAIIELYKSGKILNRTQVVDEIIPANGKKFRILGLEGQPSSDSLCIVMVVWDMATDNDTLWSVQDSMPMPHLAGQKTMRSGKADGVKKLSLCLLNDSLNDVYMSGFARIWVED